MNKKINTICFIFLFFFLICAVSAASNENETIKSVDLAQDTSRLCAEEISEKLEMSSETQKLTATSVKENVSLTAPDIKMYYKDGSKFKVTLKDKNKKAIAKAKIKITIDGKSYEKVTDSKGKCSIELNLKSGSYTVLTSFAGTSKYNSKSIKSTVTIKSTIKSSDFSKYYKNSAAYYATFYNQKGKLLKNSPSKFKINSKTYSVKTNAKGVGKVAIDLKPGKYSINAINSNTSESVSKTVTIKSLIESSDLTLKDGDSGKFNVKILNSYGKPSANKKVKITVNGNTYTKTTNKSGIAILDVKLSSGKYNITTEYNGLKSVNHITVTKSVKTTGFSHVTLIPNYANVTVPYAFKNALYTLKSGIDGIIKMPKSTVFTLQIGSNSYTVSASLKSDVDTTSSNMHYLIPFNGTSMKNDSNKDNLNGDGILISAMPDCNKIEYRDTTTNDTEMFGFYADSDFNHGETLTYMKNDNITAKINIKTQEFDETGLKYSLSKFYLTSRANENYVELTSNNTEKIRFANTGQSVTYDSQKKKIIGYTSKDEIITQFIVNGQTECERNETITYGLGEKYRTSLGFEVLQGYAIINERITKNIVEKWISQNSKYLNRFGVMNVYGMFLASQETTWLADEMADSYSREYDVSWSRGHTLTILGGINLDDTYLNILNADMGMDVNGNEKNVILFRLMNSLQLPNLEEYSLSEVAWRYMSNSTNSLENVLSAISNHRSSIAQLGKMIYIFSEDDTKSAIVYNTTSGIANVILSDGNATYKGSAISTSRDCCSVGIMPKDIIRGIKNTFNQISSDVAQFFSNIQPYSSIIYFLGKELLKPLLTGASAVSLEMFSTMLLFQTVGTTYRNNIADEKDWYSLMDTVTFTRPGYLQNKKIYNIPNKNGGYDYVEVKINSDLTLNRTNAIYISNGKTKQLTKAETYKYFAEDYWTPISMPAKYWDESWKGTVK